MSSTPRTLHLAVYAPALERNEERPLAIVHGMERAVPGLRLGWTTSESDDLIPLPHRDEWIAANGTDNGLPFLCNDDSHHGVTLTAWENAIGLAAEGPPHLEVHATLPQDSDGTAAAATALEALGETADAFWGHVLPGDVADVVAQQYHHPGDEHREPPHGLPWLEHSRSYILAPEIPHRLGWLNYWSAATARALGFPAPSRDAELRSRARRTPSGGWVVRLTDTPLDLNNPAHVNTLLRAYERFPVIGGATRFDFPQLVETILGSHAAPARNQYAHIPCEDRWLDGRLTGSTWNYRPLPVTRDHPAVLLILESPHIQEFRQGPHGTFVAVGPAADLNSGKTGYRIDQFLKCRYLSPLRQYRRGTPVYCVNAVQYQCSLNQKLTQYGKIRNEVFKGVWQRGGREGFIARLSRYYRDGDIVINACTGTKDQKDPNNLKMLVEEAVIAALCGREGRKPFQIEWKTERTVVSDSGTPHPSSYWFERGRSTWRAPRLKPSRS